jgi:hypothetical protein
MDNLGEESGGLEFGTLCESFKVQLGHVMRIIKGLILVYDSRWRPKLIVCKVWFV